MHKDNIGMTFTKQPDSTPDIHTESYTSTYSHNHIVHDRSCFYTYVPGIIIIIWTGAGSIAINGVYQAGPWDVGDPFPPSRRTLALYVVNVLNQGLSRVIVQR